MELTAFILDISNVIFSLSFYDDI